jgi:hypothetical protein
MKVPDVSNGNFEALLATFFFTEETDPV